MPLGPEDILRLLGRLVAENEELRIALLSVQSELAALKAEIDKKDDANDQGDAEQGN